MPERKYERKKKRTQQQAPEQVHQYINDDDVVAVFGVDGGVWVCACVRL